MLPSLRTNSQDLVNSKVVAWTATDNVHKPAPYDAHPLFADVDPNPYNAAGPKETGRILVVGGMGMLGEFGEAFQTDTQASS